MMLRIEDGQAGNIKHLTSKDHCGAKGITALDCAALLIDGFSTQGWIWRECLRVCSSETLI